MTGTLYLVSTPIGNLEDITVRALRALREVSLIAAEDTRRTAKLLHHYQIGSPTTSFHAHNERGKAGLLLARLEAGESVALVSDAGTPLFSDPGEDLVRQAVARGIRVEALPGASAILTALATSGLVTMDGFTFVGFPPARSHARRRWFATLAGESRPVVLFEAPHRLVAALSDALDMLGDRPLVAARELTKIHEEQVRGTIESVREHFREHSPRGEFTLIVGPGAGEAPQARAAGDQASTGARGTAEAAGSGAPGAAGLDAVEVWLFFCRMTETGATRRQAITELARLHGLSSREIYSSIERGKALSMKEKPA